MLCDKGIRATLRWWAWRDCPEGERRFATTIAGFGPSQPRARGISPNTPFQTATRWTQTPAAHHSSGFGEWCHGTPDPSAARSLATAFAWSVPDPSAARSFASAVAAHNLRPWAPRT